jgi:heme A synthase
MSSWIRQFHRWMAAIFTLAVIANVVVNFVLKGQEQLALYVGTATLIPLGLLMLTGLYMFVLPYVSRRTE